MQGFERALFLVRALEQMFDAAEWLHASVGVVRCDSVRYVERVRAVVTASMLGGAFGNMLFWPCEAMNVLVALDILSKRGKLRERNDLFEFVHDMAHRTSS